MSKVCYKGRLLSGETVSLTVENSIILSSCPIDEDEELPWLLPVLTDLQQNGGLGIAYIKATTAQELHQVAEHLLECGVGRVLATFPTASCQDMEEAARTFAKTLDQYPDLNRLFCGIFHEGVFISPEEGWRGGHNPEHIFPPDWERFSRFNQLSGGRVRMINVAPEVPGAMEFIRRAAASGISVGIGHCNPTAEQVAEAVRNGARVVTHFGNGAAPLIHRFKNPFWAMLTTPGLHLGLIGDGFHLPPELVKTALKMQPCFMVSDASHRAGCPPGTYKRPNGLTTVIEQNGFIHLEGNREILGGAWFELNRSVEFLVNQVGLPFQEAWRLCSIAPADFIKEKLPQLKPGDEATFVIANWNKTKLHIQKTVFNGKEKIFSVGKLNHLTTKKPVTEIISEEVATAVEPI